MHRESIETETPARPGRPRTSDRRLSPARTAPAGAARQGGGLPAGWCGRLAAWEERVGRAVPWVFCRVVRPRARDWRESPMMPGPVDHAAERLDRGNCRARRPIWCTRGGGSHGFWIRAPASFNARRRRRHEPELEGSGARSCWRCRPQHCRRRRRLIQIPSSD